MGSPKALLASPDGRPFVTRIVHTLREAGIVEVVVVTGRDHDALVEVLSRGPSAPLIAHNPAPSRGQLSSLLIGMDAVVREDTDAILVTLVDVPMVAVSTVARVVTAWKGRRAPIVRPAIGTRHGHPVIFDRALFNELRHAPIDAGAKSVVRTHERDLLNVPVDDEGCLIDLDTPDDYRKLISR
jgi:molybdenum cofactor cytidylyltransferase